MPYYVRVLSTSSDCPTISAMQKSVTKSELKGSLRCDGGTDDDWEQVLLCHSDGKEIAIIERNLVSEDSLGAEELAEFAEEIESCKPDSAVDWLKDFFHKVQCIYAFQVLSGTEHKNGWEILDHVKSNLWNLAPGILQADSEGFSNENGYHILWQFADSVEGSWRMGILENGKWKHFQMELSDPSHRKAFLAGKVPNGVDVA